MSQPHFPQQQYPQQQYPQGWPAPPPPVKKGVPTPVKLLIAFGVFVLVATVGALVLRGQAKPEKQAAALDVGDCVQLTGAGAEADAVKSPCDAAATPYMVSVAGIDKGEWGCSEGFYRVAIPSPKKNVALCLALNAKVGDCFDDIESKTPPKLVACSGARVKVTKVLDTISVMGSGCDGTAEQTLSYYASMDPRFKPPGTICFAKP